MLKKTGVVVALLGMCALSLFVASCGSSSNRPQGVLYVISQAATNVSSYVIDLYTGNLSLTHLNYASTCPAAPCTLPLSILLDPTATTALLLNQGSIVGYTVNADGSLSTPTTVATLSQTALGMTPDAAGDFLFVISTPASPSLANPPMISVFTTKPGSATATLASTFALTRVPTAVSAITFTPQNESTETLLFMTSNLDLTATHNDNELSVYEVDSSGNLTEQSNSPYSTQVNPTAVQAVNTNPVGQTTGGIFVYAASQDGTGPGSVSGFEVCSIVIPGGCTQQEVQNNVLLSIGTPTTMASCQYPIATAVDPTNSFLYIACNVSGNLYGFHMLTGTGALTSLTESPPPAGTGPMSLVMHNNYNNGGEYLYVSDNGGSTIFSFDVALTTGLLSNPNSVLFYPGSPSGMAGR